MKLNVFALICLLTSMSASASRDFMTNPFCDFFDQKGRTLFLTMQEPNDTKVGDTLIINSPATRKGIVEILRERVTKISKPNKNTWKYETASLTLTATISAPSSEYAPNTKLKAEVRMKRKHAVLKPVSDDVRCEFPSATDQY